MKKTKEEPYVRVEPGSEKVVLFGWCMTNHHELCKIAFPGHRCSCECHSDLAENVVEEDE